MKYEDNRLATGEYCVVAPESAIIAVRNMVVMFVKEIWFRIELSYACEIS